MHYNNKVLGMFENLKNGLKTANAVRKLVFADKGLFAYPIITALAAIILGIIMFVILIFLFITSVLVNWSGAAQIVLVLIILYLYYLAVFFIETYLTAAMLISFREYAKGKNSKISFNESINRTKPYLKLLFEWAVFYTIIATIIRIIEGLINRAMGRGLSGAVISSVISGAMNLAFAAAIAFSLPVILDEKKGPIDTIKLSAKFIISNFGETFGGLIFTELFQILFAVIGIISIIGGVLLFGSSVILGVILVAIGFIVIVTGVVLRYVLFNCFKLIIYDYKTRKVLPKGFDKQLIDNSIKKKQGNKPGGINPLSFGMGQQGGL